MFERGDYAQAVEAYLRSLELAESHPAPQFELEAHLGLVELYCAVGDVAAAAEHLAVAEGFTSSTARGWNSWLLSAHAEILLLRGDGAAALRLAEQVLTLVDQSADPSAEFVALELLGRAQLAVGRPDDALDTFRRVVACTFATTSPLRRATGHEGAAAAAAALGRLDDAHENLAAANEIRQHTHSRRVHRPVIDQHLARLDRDTVATDGPMHDIPVVVQE